MSCSSVQLTAMKSPLSQASSLTASKQGRSLPAMLTLQWWTSGYWVDEWFPQMITFFTWVAGTLQRMATWWTDRKLSGCLMARTTDKDVPSTFHFSPRHRYRINTLPIYLWCSAHFVKVFIFGLIFPDRSVSRQAASFTGLFYRDYDYMVGPDQIGSD